MFNIFLHFYDRQCVSKILDFFKSEPFTLGRVHRGAYLSMTPGTNRQDRQTALNANRHSLGSAYLPSGSLHTYLESLISVLILKSNKLIP